MAEKSHSIVWMTDDGDPVVHESEYLLVKQQRDGYIARVGELEEQLSTIERERDEYRDDARSWMTGFKELKEQLEALREAAEKLRHFFDPAEMRWMSVEDSFIDVPARTVAEIGRALGRNPATSPE